MSTTISSGGAEFYRVTKRFRWFSVAVVPPMLALMAWAAWESIRNHLSEEIASPLWATAIMLTLYGGVSFALVSAIVWAFRAHVRIDAESMSVQGAYRRTVIRPDLLDGFRVINGRLNVYLKNRSWALQIAYFEQIWSIEHWVRQRTTDIDQSFLDEEAGDISADVSLGYHIHEKASQLAFLRELVRRANYLIYTAISIGTVNFLFIENLHAERITVAALVLTPLILNFLALSHRAHIRIDHDEGTQYPQIFTATCASGVTLMFFALLDRGALLNNDLYRYTALGTLISGLLWCLIDMKRLSVLRERGRAVVIMTVAAFFMIPAAWVGGSLYHYNKLVDVSEPVWYQTTVVEKTRASGGGTSYSIDLAPWSEGIDGPVKVTLRRREFDLYQSGMSVRVAVREGAINIPWVTDVQKGVPKGVGSN